MQPYKLFLDTLNTGVSLYCLYLIHGMCKIIKKRDDLDNISSNNVSLDTNNIHIDEFDKLVLKKKDNLTPKYKHNTLRRIKSDTDILHK